MEKQQIKLSRTKIQLFLDCPKCFYLSVKLGIHKPAGYPFTLNNAVDILLKEDFDKCRLEQRPHPFMIDNHINAIPFLHEKMTEWRENFVGVQYLHPKYEFLLFGAVDDIWQDCKTEQLYVVDYKATSSDKEITLNEEWKQSYKNQIGFYQYLLQNNGFEVSNKGYFVYCNALKRPPDTIEFNNLLKFDVKVIEYESNLDWIEETLEKVNECLNNNDPQSSSQCKYCQYVENRNKAYYKIKASHKV